MAEAIHDCESLRYFCSRDGPEMVRASGTEERRVMIRPPRFHFIFGNGLALDLYLDRSDLKYCCGWTQTTSKTMLSTVALKDFFNTWFNSPENKADIEASFRDLANSACPLMHAMVVARCTKPKGCVAIVAAVSFRVEQRFVCSSICLCRTSFLLKDALVKRPMKVPSRMLDLANYSWRSPIFVQGQVLLHPLQLMPVPSLQLMPVPALPLMFSLTTNLRPFITFILKQVTLL
jgi:hypothetical protein